MFSLRCNISSSFTCLQLPPIVSVCLTCLHLSSVFLSCLYLSLAVSPVPTCLTSTVQVKSEPSSRVTLVCIVLKLSGFLAGEWAIRLLDDRWLTESSPNEVWAWLRNAPPTPPCGQRKYSHISHSCFKNCFLSICFIFFTCLDVEWAVASGIDFCDSPGSAVMVIHLRESDDTVTMEINNNNGNSMKWQSTQSSRSDWLPAGLERTDLQPQTSPL